MKILVFTEGTIFTHQIPIGQAARKLQGWKREGVEIVYLTSRREPADIVQVRDILQRYGFPAGELLFRKVGEEYKDVAEKALPDIIIEDDCESIGGEVEMTYPHIRAEIKAKIKSIVVKDGGGVDHLPDRVNDLVD